MSRLSTDVLAAQAGVEPDHVTRLVELGLLVPDASQSFTTGDVRRIRILDSLVTAGLPLAGLAEAIRRGDLSLDFVDQPSYDRFAALGEVSFRELSEQTGVPLDLLLVVREAMGFAGLEPDDRVRESELPVALLIELELRHGVRPASIERSLRVFGDSMRRMAETEADWWRSDVLGPLFAAGLGVAEVGRRTAELATDLEDAADQAILAVYHGQQAHAWMRNIFEGFEGILARTGLHTPLERPPAICFLDLTGYSRLTEERGDAAAAELASRLARLVQGTSAEHGGKPVKWLGDGVMFFFRDPGPGVAAALAMVEGASKAGLPPAHVGLHAGPVLFQEGDYFGRTVNTAARIADYARPGEVLVSQAVLDAGAVDGIAFEALGPVELKGLPGALVLHRARRASA